MFVLRFLLFCFLLKWRGKHRNIKRLLNPDHDFYLGNGTFNACPTPKIPLLLPRAEMNHTMCLNQVSHKSKLAEG